MASSEAGDNESATPTSRPVIETSQLSDPGWAHCTALTSDKKKIRCNYCGKEMVGGINRLKKHIARIPGDAVICPKVPDDVSKRIKNLLEMHGEKKQAAAKRKATWRMFGESKGLEEGDSTSVEEELMRKGKHSSSESQSVRTSQMKLPTSMDAGARKRVNGIIARWFFHSAIPFHAADSIYFPRVAEAIGSYGPTYKPPTPYELSGALLDDEVVTLNTHFNEMKRSWSLTGCSIMSDGWTDQRGRSIINFLVSCPRGTMFIKSVDASSIVKDATNLFKLLDDIVEEVGEENVIQVITDNAANYVAAGKHLMEKRKNLFWTSCAAHNMDLMLEKIGELKSVNELINSSKKVAKFIYNHGLVLNLMRQHTNGKEILRPGATRFATNFILTGSLLERRAGLKSMIQSEEWLKSKFSTLAEGMEMEKIILDNTFWRKLEKLQTTISPLTYVLRMVDGDKQPAMGLIYDALDRAKLAISEAYENKPERYMKFWKIIDARWESTLHSPLHAAGYFLNPAIRYRGDFSTHPEVRRGLQTVIGRLLPDMSDQIDALSEITQFEQAMGDFGGSLAINSRKSLSPVAWWQNFGMETPILQKIAIRVLSQNCSATGCERNWSTFDHIHTKKRNRLKQEKLNKLVFVHYNLRLMEQQLRRHSSDYDPTVLDNILFENHEEEWVADNEDEGLANVHIGESSTSTSDFGGVRVRIEPMSDHDSDL